MSEAGGDSWTGDVVLDYDYHPPDRLQLFTIERGGVLRSEDEVLVTEALHGDVVLRHYAFADRWFKVNCTTDAFGHLTETESTEAEAPPFAFNCDIATPMVREGDAVFAVDLWLDVFVRADGQSYRVADSARFGRAVKQGLLSSREARCAEAGLRELIELIEREMFVGFLADVCPFRPSTAPPALPMRVVPTTGKPLIEPHRRPTWEEHPP